MESPRWSSGEKEPREAERRLRCDGCDGEDFYDADDGFYYCSVCGAQSQDVVDAACADEDIHGDAGEGALYSIFHHRKSQPHTPAPKNPNMEQIMRNLSQNLAGGGVKEEAESGRAFGFEDEASGPQDFGGGGPCPDAESLRLRYVQGLQVMLQRQCEALVERFGVSPLICGLAGTIWLRYVAASRVFEEGWADKVIAESEAAMTAARSRDGQSEEPDWMFMKKKQNQIALLFGIDDHWGPLSLFEEISKQVPGIALSIEREGHTHAFCCTEAGSNWVARHVTTLIKNQIPTS